ncbi:protein kinase superfamily protein [Actinidia rufa]|uniref:Protein kinase superfamily protein n=1 Tax=Actinidia rufa TaxID=165716 RepID=A0A7J0EPM0_9ERIC|nr:protein kinase superfamily protein [Actinidia rufa]
MGYCTVDRVLQRQWPSNCAVKSLRNGGAQGQGCEEWMFLSRLNHPNAVKLMGYCSEGKHRILAYEYMKGSLESHLLIAVDTELSWSRRIKIALGSAKGLEYLHHAGRPVVHVESSPLEVPRVTRPTHPPIYSAQEVTSLPSMLQQVYSFGVLLEILSGLGAVKRYSDSTFGDLATWARPYLSNRLAVYHVVDKRLGGDVRIEEAYEFAQFITTA